MDIKSKYESRLQKTALSCEKFTTGYFVLFALFAVPYIAASTDRLILWFLPIACLVPLAVMPLVYLLVHRFDTLLFGRYHLIMPLSAFIAALFFVLIWSADGYGLSAFFGTLVFGTAIAAYRYCAYSVRARLSGDSSISVSPYSQIFSLLGAASALVTLGGFMYYDPATAYINTAYVLAGANVVLAMLQYLVTYYDIPQLGGRRAINVKKAYATFYTGLDVRTFASALLFGAAKMCLTTLTVLFAFLYGMHVFYAVTCAAVETVCYCAVRGALAKSSVCGDKRAPIIILSGYIAATAVLIVAAAVGLKGNALIATVCIAAGLTGMTGAFSAGRTEAKFKNVKPHATSGTVFILIELTEFVAIAIALFVAAIAVETVNATGSVIACGCGIAAAVVFALAAFIVSSLRRGAPKTKARADADGEDSADKSDKSDNADADGADIVSQPAENIK